MKNYKVFFLLLICFVFFIAFFLWDVLFSPHSIIIENKSGVELYRIVVLYPDGHCRFIDKLANNENQSVTHSSQQAGLPELFFTTDQSVSVYTWHNKPADYVSPHMGSIYPCTITPADILSPINVPPPADEVSPE